MSKKQPRTRKPPTVAVTIAPDLQDTIQRIAGMAMTSPKIVVNVLLATAISGIMRERPPVGG
jgi:hypothetical protein